MVVKVSLVVDWRERVTEAAAAASVEEEEEKVAAAVGAIAVVDCSHVHDARNGVLHTTRNAITQVALMHCANEYCCCYVPCLCVVHGILVQANVLIVFFMSEGDFPPFNPLNSRYFNNFWQIIKYDTLGRSPLRKH